MLTYNFYEANRFWTWVGSYSYSKVGRVAVFRTELHDCIFAWYQLEFNFIAAFFFKLNFLKRIDSNL